MQKRLLLLAAGRFINKAWIALTGYFLRVYTPFWKETLFSRRSVTRNGTWFQILTLWLTKNMPSPTVFKYGNEKDRPHVPHIPCNLQSSTFVSCTAGSS